MNALFSRIILRTCLVKDSSCSSVTTDRFIKTKGQKTPAPVPQALTESDVVCFWGPPGIGKTHLVAESGGIWLTEETLRAKQVTLEFLGRVRSSDRPVIIDDFETVSDLVGLRELTGRPSRGRLFITARSPVKLSFPVFNVEFPVPTREKLFKIVSKIKPEADPLKIHDLAERAQGSVRFVLQGLEFDSDAHDNFQEPKRDLEVLLVKGAKGGRPCLETLHEHGYSWAVVQENYPDAPHLTLTDIADIADMMSRAALIDDCIYRKQQWELLPYFAVDAVFAPSMKIKKTLKKLRPGSMWTKYQNECMKRKKLESILAKIGGGTTTDHIPILISHASRYPQLTAQDVAFMKKICTFK